MKLTRREFAKTLSFLTAAAFLPITLLTGCGVDAIISGLDVALSVLGAAASIAGLNPLIGIALQKVGVIVGDVIKGYHDYEAAEATLKPGFLGTLEAAISTAQKDLAKILTDVGVTNPGLLSIINTAVAIANSAILALIHKLGSPSKARIALARGLAKPLPTVPNAKSANDLKKAWNDAVKAEHPEAAIQ